jgi:RimJ/RimL family protein N-acetyltransferase
MGAFRPVERLPSARLWLRPVDAADLPDLLEVNGDEVATRFLPYAAWRDMDDAEAWFARTQALVAAGGAQQLVLEQRAGGRVIGSVLLFRHEPGSARIEIGYVLGRAHWRRGYAREALTALLDLLFGESGIRRVEAEVNPANAASNALLLGLGFRHEGVLRQRWVAKGVAYDVNAWGLLAPEWRAGGAAVQGSS